MTTLPVFLADPQQLAQAQDELTLTGPEAHHAATVRRLRTGERIDLVDGRGLRVQAEVLDAAEDALRLRLGERAQEPARAPELILVQALAKGDRDLQAAESCTELGADEVIPWQAERSIARLRPERQAKQLAKWDALLRAAAKQSRRARWPRLGEPQDTAGLARLIADRPQVVWLVLHESAPVSLLPALGLEPSSSDADGRARDALARAQGIGLIAGPEGGISDAELERLTAAGARPVLLGPEVLRSSTAGAAAMAVLSAVIGRW